MTSKPGADKVAWFRNTHSILEIKYGCGDYLLQTRLPDDCNGDPFPGCTGPSMDFSWAFKDPKRGSFPKILLPNPKEEEKFVLI